MSWLAMTGATATWMASFSASGSGTWPRVGFCISGSTVIQGPHHSQHSQEGQCADVVNPEHLIGQLVAALLLNGDELGDLLVDLASVLLQAAGGLAIRLGCGEVSGAAGAA